MSMDHRLQILIDDQRYQRISAVAKERGVSVATVGREAIDRGVVDLTGRRRAAARLILDAPPMPLPDDLLAELDELRARRG